MAGAIIRRLSLAKRRPDVVLAGGVFAARDAVFERAIREVIQAVAPGANVRRSLGAALLGLDRLPEQDRRAVDARLRASLGAWRPTT